MEEEQDVAPPLGPLSPPLPLGPSSLCPFQKLQMSISLIIWVTMERSRCKERRVESGKVCTLGFGIGG